MRVQVPLAAPALDLLRLVLFMSISSRFHTWVATSTLFYGTPPAIWPGQYAYAAFLAVCGVAAIVLLLVRFYPPVQERLSTLLWTNLFLGLLLYFLRVQQIPALGMDFWRYIQEISFVIWLGVILNFARIQYPIDQLAARVTERKTKYLPKPKSH